MSRACTRVVIVLVVAIQLTGCASLTGKKRVATGVVYGGAIGGVGGAILSPNDENRGLNALVFGLTGALLGGIAALLTDTDTTAAQPSTLKDRELGSSSPTREIEMIPNQDLPEFLKKRVQPVVIEEYIEADRVSEEGTLHEPHKAYRIKRPVELFAHPTESETKTATPMKGVKP